MSIEEPDPYAKCGIRNQGSNTCYMNAAIQLLYCMSNVRELVDLLKDADYPTPRAREVIDGKKQGPAIYTAAQHDKRKTTAKFLSDTFALLHQKTSIESLLTRKRGKNWTNNGFDQVTKTIAKWDRYGDMADSSELVIQLLEKIMDLNQNDEFDSDTDEHRKASEITEYLINICKTRGDVKETLARTNSSSSMTKLIDPRRTDMDLEIPWTVRGRLDTLEEVDFPEADNGKPFEACPNGRYSKKTIHKVSDAHGKYIVFQLDRQTDFDNRADPFKLKVEPSLLIMPTDAELTAYYELIGAIMFNQFHYFFVRVNHGVVVRVYDDDRVHVGPDAINYMSDRELTLAQDASVLLYRRLSTKSEVTDAEERESARVATRLNEEYESEARIEKEQRDRQIATELARIEKAQRDRLIAERARIAKEKRDVDRAIARSLLVEARADSARKKRHASVVVLSDDEEQHDRRITKRVERARRAEEQHDRRQPEVIDLSRDDARTLAQPEVIEVIDLTFGSIVRAASGSPGEGSMSRGAASIFFAK